MSILLLNQEICLPTGAVLAPPSAAAILAATIPDGTVQNMTASILAANQPGTLCNTGMALAMVVTDGPGTIVSARFYVTGFDCRGAALAERVYTNVAGSNSYPLTKPFHTIDYCEQQGVGFGAGQTISLGVTGVFGLPAPIIQVSDVVVARVDAGVEAAPTISVANNTWTPASAPNGARRFYVNILAA